ncbi:protein D1 [Bemisia tabaci]|uniref:protein D1 n=1 Tax=Bemisia tabaci TaxID=7038 RepID=UPI003B289AB0
MEQACYERMNRVLGTLCVFVYLKIFISNYCAVAAPGATKTASLRKKTPAEIKDKLLKFNVIPDIIPVESFPEHEIQVVWPEAKADLGNLIPPHLTMTQPNVSWPSSEGYYYTLLMVDPDRDQDTEFGESKDFMNEYQCWLVGNIPGSNLSAGEKFTDYVPPIKPKPLYFMRTVFFVFEHANKTTIKYEEPRLLSDSGEDAWRAHFRTRKFMKKYGFKNAYAVNFFHGEWDAWVPPGPEEEAEMLITLSAPPITTRSYWD